MIHINVLSMTRVWRQVCEGDDIQSRGRERFVVKIQEHLKKKHVLGTQMLTLDETAFFPRARYVILKQKEDPEDIDLYT